MMTNFFLFLLMSVVVSDVLATQDLEGNDAYGARRIRRQSNVDNHGHCGLDFPCGNATQCVTQSQQCDGTPDCENGADEDEEQCDDQYDYKHIDELFGKKEDDDDDKDLPPRVPCEDREYPEQCECYVMSEDDEVLGLELLCHQAGFTSIPRNLPRDTIYLGLAANNITTIAEDSFDGVTFIKKIDLQSNKIVNFHPRSLSKLRRLEVLDLSSNRISWISSEHFEGHYFLKELTMKHNPIKRLNDSDMFKDLISLETLNFFGASISELRTGIFEPLTKLTNLVLSHNQIEALTQGNMAGLATLQILDLQNNDISFIEDGAFTELESLQQLRLHGNKLNKVKRGMFVGLPRLRTLLLDRNKIETIDAGSFGVLLSLQHFTISDNLLKHLSVGMFEGLSRVTSLGLFDNQIETIENGTFAPLSNLQSMNLERNPFRIVPRGVFDIMPNLDHIYFDHFILCGFAPHVKDCNPKGDGVSNSENLLGSIVLRVSVWMVSILATFGNLVVLFARCVSKDDNKVHSFFIINLAVSDFLMGAYLFIVAIHDVIYRGSYIVYDLDWRSGWVCKMCGAFSLLSSEMSVFTLTIITADRYFCIVHPFRFRNRHILPAAILMASLWILGITLALLPLVYKSYFGDFFYGANGVCLPLQFDRPFDEGWVFSLFVFVVANLLSFVFIVWAYIRMFTTIHRSNLAARSTKVSQDYALLKRFTIIVATDFLCWMPIIIVKFVTYGGVSIPPTAHAWFAIFILPVNSALNPILYTMTTRQFKRMLFHPSRALIGMSKSVGANEMSQSVSRSRDREMGNTATSRLSVISHSHQMKNGGGTGTPGGTPATERNARTENMLSDDENKEEKNEDVANL